MTPAGEVKSLVGGEGGRRAFLEEIGRFAPAARLARNSRILELAAWLQECWKEPIQFLRVPGALLDNNETERILKMSILHRKNSLFYRTQRGAEVGDLLMSLIQTCRANRINPFDDLLAVVRNAKAAAAGPERCTP